MRILQTSPRFNFHSIPLTNHTLHHHINQNQVNKNKNYIKDKMHLPKVPKIIEVIWRLTSIGWFKYNTNGS